jgi:hypothetical protein
MALEDITSRQVHRDRCGHTEAILDDGPFEEMFTPQLSTQRPKANILDEIQDTANVR